MKRIIFIIAFLTSIASNAQTIKFVAEDSLMGAFDRFSVDNFGKIYVTRNDVVMSFSKDLDTLFTGSLKSIRPSSIESSKSFRTLIFDQERSVIKFLDNTLTDIHDEIDLVLHDIQQPILVCESFGGNTIWILDADNLRLIRMNEKLEKVQITENLIQIFQGDVFPSQMKEVNDFLLVLVPEIGVARFDVFGTYMDMYPCKAESIDAMGKYLFVKKDSTMEIIPLEGLLEPEFVYDLPPGILDFAYTREHVYFRMRDGIRRGNFRKFE